MTDAIRQELVQVPSDCPEYIRCSASICPLDVDWQKRTYGTGEPTCLFLRETVKLGAEQRLSVNIVFAELYRISQRWLAEEKVVAENRTVAGMARGRGDHLRTILAAANSGSTLDKRAAAGERLATARDEKRQASITLHTSAS